MDSRLKKGENRQKIKCFRWELMKGVEIVLII